MQTSKQIPIDPTQRTVMAGQVLPVCLAAWQALRGLGGSATSSPETPNGRFVYHRGRGYADMAGMSIRLKSEPSVTADSDAHRQAVIESYGLARGSRALSDDAGLTPFTELAQKLTGSDCAAVHIIDDRYQAVLASSARILLRISSREASMCDWALRTGDRTGVTHVSDTLTHPVLHDNPWVTGALGKIRSYAAVPLLTPDGVALGTLCVWWLKPADDVAERSAQLPPLRDAVMAALESRKSLHQLVQQGQSSTHVTKVEAPARITGEAWPIDSIIDDRTVRTIFQPIVHLATGAVVGFEALTRGPAGSPLETPLELIAAAKAAGRLGELDWLCRATALHAAAQSGFHPSVSWFVNVEPAGLAIECPAHLRRMLSSARSDLRVVLEVVERDVEGHVADLLHATDQARLDAWGVALDDVGAEEGSLALLPFLQPDVVKLDMSLVQKNPHRATAVISAAVQAYAERRGAVILAEGIETEAHAQLALVLGATYGQGYLFGAPAALPDHLPTPREPIPLRQRPAALSGQTPFEVLADKHPARIGSKRTLLHISDHLEAMAGQHEHAGVLLASFQHARFFSPRMQQVYRRLARQGAYTVVVAEDVVPILEPRFEVLPLPAESPLRHEWQVIVIAPHYAAAFVAKDHGDTGADGERRFSYVYTHNRDDVVGAARAYLQHRGLTHALDAQVKAA